MTRNDRRSENPIGAFADVNLDEAVLLAVDERPIYLTHRYREGLDADPLRTGLVGIQSDVGDLGIGIRARRDGERAQALAAEKERVLNDDACRCVGGVRKAAFQANV